MNMKFNPTPATWMHIDINSCFATIEQQANPLLRDRPIAVAAYLTDSGCILAPSIEAKTYGVATGMRVREAKQLCPQIKILASDVNKYRHTHRLLRQLLEKYSPLVVPKSIDEFIVDLSPQLYKFKHNHQTINQSLQDLAQTIKRDIRSNIGDWLSVSIGFGPNRFLAKTAAGMIKPNGLMIIDKQNFRLIYTKLRLTDLTGIALRRKIRLNSVGIYSVLDFYQAPIEKLRQAFGSRVEALHWHAYLRGWQYDPLEFERQSIGNSYSPPEQITTTRQLLPILMKLTQKTTDRLRRSQLATRRVAIYINFRSHPSWGDHQSTPPLFSVTDIYFYLRSLLTFEKFPSRIHTVAITCSNLIDYQDKQLDLYGELDRKERVNQAMDLINQRYGEFTLTPALMMTAKDLVPDRISFGKVKEL